MRRSPSPTGVVVVGPGARFFSGISQYTAALANALAAGGSGPVTALLFDHLCPAAAYPGRNRLGTHHQGALGYTEEVEVVPCLNWYWGWGIVVALTTLVRRRPRALVLTWWTGTALHTHLLLAVVARSLGVTVVIEFHESFDPSEVKVPGVRAYVRAGMRVLARWADVGVVHSRADATRLAEELPLGDLHLEVVHLGPLGRFELGMPRPVDGPVHYLFFGIQRPYKGLDVLAEGFALLTAAPADGGIGMVAGEDAELIVAGEHWGGCEAAREALGTLEGVALRDGYVSEGELGELFAWADVIVLPYLRSAASGPLHLAMSCGLPLVVSALPALVEVVEEYGGAETYFPGSAEDLAWAMAAAAKLRGIRYRDPDSWERVSGRFAEILDAAGDADRTPTPTTGPVVVLGALPAAVAVVLRSGRPEGGQHPRVSDPGSGFRARTSGSDDAPSIERRRAVVSGAPLEMAG
jgi:glycosyltransferase involved in cell wall biosynthesis